MRIAPEQFFTPADNINAGEKYCYQTKAKKYPKSYGDITELVNGFQEHMGISLGNRLTSAKIFAMTNGARPSP